MAGSILKLSDVKLAVKNAELNFKIQTSELNGTEDSITFIDECSKTKVRGKIVRSFNEGEVYHWPSLDHDNVARLIDILRVHDDLCIYLTIHNEVTLKNIVHDENFVYDSRCFDRKRSYAKGIFSGLSYLHGKSLALMNLCDDNIIISKTDDKAIITDFDHLTMQQKVTRSRLHIPEIYMAPETIKGQFDAIKAEIWASGILMLDMFLAHMVPWAIVNHNAKKVTQIVDNISLDLLQAANAGSVVSALDLAKFQLFLKRFFFKQKPLERTPVKYACIASFLQNRNQYKTIKYSHEIFPSLENTLPMNYANLNLSKEDFSIFLNPTYNPPCSSKSPKAQKREIGHVTYDASSSKTQQTERLVRICENKTENDLSLRGNLKSNINVEKDKFSLPALYTNAVFTVDTETTADLQETEKNCEAVNAACEDVIEPSYDNFLSKYFSFIKPERRNSNADVLNLFSQENCYYLNSKPSAKQYSNWDSQSSDLGLNNLFNNINNNDEFDNNTDDCTKSNSIIESGRMDAQTGETFSEIPIQHMQIETQIKQLIPYTYESNASLEAFKKPIVKPPRSSKGLPIYLSSQVESILTKIIFLRRCYISIHTHQKVSISKEFDSKQRKLLNEYQTLLIEENLRLREILRKKNELKFKDIAKLMRIVDFRVCNSAKRNENLSEKQNIYKYPGNRLPQPQETQGAIKCDVNSIKYSPIHKVKNANIPSVRPKQNYSYYGAIENADYNQDRKWGINGQVNSEKSKKTWERSDLVVENQVKRKFIPDTIESDKMYEIGKQNKISERNAKAVDSINFYCGADVKYRKIKPPNTNYNSAIGKAENIRKLEISGQLDGEKTKRTWKRIDFLEENKLKHEFTLKTTKSDEMTKARQVARKMNEVVKQDERREGNVKIVYKMNYDCEARQKQLEKQNTETEPKREFENIRQKTDKEEKTMQVNNCQKKLSQTTDRQKKKLSKELKKLEKPKRSRFFSFLCPGGKAEKPTPVIDSLCETCKLNLENRMIQ